MLAIALWPHLSLFILSRPPALPPPCPQRPLRLRHHHPPPYPHPHHYHPQKGA